MARYTRSNFYEKEVIEGVNECDFLRSKISRFKIKRPTKYYTITYDDLMRPDLLSFKLYGKQDYWWLLLYANNVIDPWNELQENDVIQVPDEQDILDWLMETKNG